MVLTGPGMEQTTFIRHDEVADMSLTLKNKCSSMLLLATQVTKNNIGATQMLKQTITRNLGQSPT